MRKCSVTVSKMIHYVSMGSSLSERSLSFKIRQEELDEKWGFLKQHFFLTVKIHEWTHFQIFWKNEYHNFLWAEECFFFMPLAQYLRRPWVVFISGPVLNNLLYIPLPIPPTSHARISNQLTKRTYLKTTCQCKVLPEVKTTRRKPGGIAVRRSR